VLSRNGDGRYGFLNTPEEAATEFAGQLAGALHVAAADVKVQIEFNPTRVTAYRRLVTRSISSLKNSSGQYVDAAEIGAAESGNALYVIEVNPGGEGPLATVRVRSRFRGPRIIASMSGRAVRGKCSGAGTSWLRAEIGRERQRVFRVASVQSLCWGSYTGPFA